MIHQEASEYSNHVAPGQAHFNFLMEQVLLLNITYEPLKVINWKKAIIMLTLGKVEVIEEYTREVHSVSFAIKLPAVVRLL
ncbi:MAG TPA: hypothetical protein VMW42_10625, partial [Desulfatiglandales bacterium]|nr:hypothetical protein [Desulfatiglandales bacterium]